MTVFATSNELQISYASEAGSPGVIPAVAFQTLRSSGQTLDANLTFVTSKEFRADRQIPSNIISDAKPGGEVTVELSYGVADDLFAASVQGVWSILPTKTNVSTTNPNTYNVASGGASFVQYMLLFGSNFINAANNGIKHVNTGGTGTTVVVTETLVTEVAGATKTIKVVGLEGPAGDIVATVAVGTVATLTSTLVDFTTMGLTVGQFIKIGGAAAGNKYATAANNTFVRITAIAAHTLSIDNLPVGWAADVGAAKTIRIQFGEYLRNGVTVPSFTVQREHLDKSLFFAFTGMEVDQSVFTLQAGQITTAKMTMKGLGFQVAATNFGTGADIAAPTGVVLNGVNNVIKIWEGNAQSAAFTKTVTLTTKNNLRDQTAIGTLGNVGIGDGQFMADIAFDVYLQDLSLVNKFYAQTATAIGFVQQDGAGNAYVFYMPSVTITQGKVNAAAINQDVMFALTASAQIDTLTGVMFQQDRLTGYSGF